MIFVITGTQLPFNRLFRIVDEWNIEKKEEIIYQGIVKQNSKSGIKCFESLSYKEFLANLKRARLIVSHAGVGSILDCLTNEAPFIVFPRRSRYNEHRNDHQHDTCLALQNKYNLNIAFEENNLIDLFTS